MLKTSKQKRLKTIVLAAALACSPMLVNAAGLGRITVLSSLGQPLRAELEITANKDELNSLAARLASAEAFRVAGIEYAPALSTLHFSRDVKERNGKRYIEVTTDRPVNDPFIDMLVELNWASGRLVREYTFLLDPPGLVQKSQPAPVTAPEVKIPAPAAVAQPEAPRVVQSPVPSIRSEPVATPAPVPVELALKAAPALQKPASVPAVVKREVDATREIKLGDTLGKIAAETKPDGISLDQMLVALFRKNADAFDGNMNRMRAGKILSLPDASAAREIDAKEARREVLAQSSDFNAYRRKLADAVAGGLPSAEAGGRTSSGKISPKVEDKVPAPASSKDKLEVSRTETTATTKSDAKGGSKSAPLQGRLSALEEDVVSRERALREASSRIVQLEKNLVDLKKLAEMKSEAGAAMQKQAESAKPATAPPPVAAAPTKPAEAPAKAPEPAPVVSSPPPAATPVPEAPKPPPKKKVIPPPEPEPEPTFIEENGPLVFGGAGVLALLLGYLGFSAYRRKKKAAADEAPISRADLSTNSVFSEAASESINVTAASPSEFSISESSLETGAVSVDPLVEADTYLAFGRDAQAEEILLEALKAEPTRHAIHVKLLEIYSARRSAMQFNTLAQELRDQTGAQGGDWEKVLAMGLALDPNNPLYRPPEVAATAGESVAPKPVDLDATMVFSAPPVLEPPPAATPLPGAPPVQQEVASLDFDLDLGETPAVAPRLEGIVAETGKDDTGGLDFDLELGDGTSAMPSAVEPSPAAFDSAHALDIDFNLDTPVAGPSDDAFVQVSEVVPEPVPASDDAASALDIDFDATVALEAAPAVPAAADEVDFSLDIELPAANTSGEMAASLAAAEAAPATIDFDFNLGDPEPAVVPAAPALDLSAVSLELETPVAPAAVTVSDLDLDLELPSLGDVAGIADESPLAVEDDVADNPEAATKLELALAYEEMGDKEGARELLEEVVKEGSPVQREAAQAKLAVLI